MKIGETGGNFAVVNSNRNTVAAEEKEIEGEGKLRKDFNLK